MSYYKQGYDEAQGNSLSMEAYRERRDELKKQHGELIFTIQAKYEKRRRLLQGQIHALNKALQADIQSEMERYKAEKAELTKLIDNH